MVFCKIYETWSGEATIAKLLHVLNYDLCSSLFTTKGVCEKLELPEDHVFEDHSDMVRAGMRVSDKFCRDCAGVVAIFAMQLCKVHGSRTVLPEEESNCHREDLDEQHYGDPPVDLGLDSVSEGRHDADSSSD